MVLNDNEFGIGTLHKDGEFHDAIIITKDALERLEKAYTTRAEESDKLGADTMASYLYGRADLLTSLRQLIDPSADIL